MTKRAASKIMDGISDALNGNFAAVHERTAESKETLAVKVKPLEWRGPERGFYEADVLGETVHIMVILYNEPGRFVLHPCTNDRQKFDTLDAAKAAVQADYERRIRSALVPSAPISTDADLMERMAGALNAAAGFLHSQDKATGITCVVDAVLADYKAMKRHKTAD